MEIIFNHITRMSNQRICVAGIDAETFEQVRPTTPRTDPITRSLLRQEGGPIGMGAVVDIGAVTPEPSPPETEDHRFQTANVRHVEDLDGDTFLELLKDVSDSDIQKAFGPSLQLVRRTYAVDAGCGQRSLAVVRTRGQPRLIVDSYNKLRLQIPDLDGTPALSVADVRFYEADHKTIKTEVVNNVSNRLAKGVEVFLMLGLPRATEMRWDDRERHWLQLNGLCLADDPVGDAP